MNIIKSEILQTEFDPSAFLSLSDAQQQELAALAKQQSVAQLLGDALGKNPATKDLPITQKLFKETMLSLNYTSRIETEREKICCILEESGIEYMPLKGARIRSYYPHAWMRSSCDNDILVHETDLDQAVALLNEKLDCDVGEKSVHDIPLTSKSSATLELHFNLDSHSETMNRVLDQVWNAENICKTEGSCQVLQSNEFFLFYLISHLANHILGGGCGFRPVIDLYLLFQRMPFDENQLKLLCRQAGIEPLYEHIRSLISIWFENGSHTQATQRLEDFLLSSDTYGSQKNHIAVVQQRYGNKMGGISYRVFLPMKKLRKMYPVLDSRPWLIPVCQVRRWGRLIFKKRYKKSCPISIRCTVWIQNTLHPHSSCSEKMDLITVNFI